MRAHLTQFLFDRLAYSDSVRAEDRGIDMVRDSVLPALSCRWTVSMQVKTGQN
jgi:hypothetical protein